METEKVAEPHDVVFLRDLAARLFKYATPAQGFDQGDVDQVYRIASRLSAEARSSGRGGVGEDALREVSMDLEIALDFADNPRPYHSLAAPADTNGELYRALTVIAAAYRARIPVEPTGAMLEAGEQARRENTDMYLDGSEVARDVVPAIWSAMCQAALSQQPTATEEIEGFRWPRGATLRKRSGSQWHGRVVGFYSTDLTPEGYAIESETEKGSVQIYPAKALEEWPTATEETAP